MVGDAIRRTHWGRGVQCGRTNHAVWGETAQLARSKKSLLCSSITVRAIGSLSETTPRCRRVAGAALSWEMTHFGPDYLGLAELSLNFPMMDWSEGLDISNALEGAVCTMCAPKDQRKSTNDQREPTKLDARRSAGLRVISYGGVLRLGRFFL